MNVTARSIMWSFLIRHKIRMMAAVFTALTGSFLTVLLPLSIGAFQALYSGGEGSKSGILKAVGIHMTSFNEFFFVFTILILARLLCSWGENYCYGWLGSNWTKEMRGKLFQAQLHQRPGVFSSRAPGYYLLRFAGDMSSTKNIITKGIIKASADLSLLIFSSAALFFMDPTLAWTLCILLLIISPISYLFSIVSSRSKSTESDRKASLLRFITDSYYHFVTIKALNRETPEINKFQRKSEALYNTSLEGLRSTAWQKAFSEIFFFILIGSLLYVAVKSKSESFANGNLLVLILIVLYLRASIKRIFQLPQIWSAGKQSLNKILEILSLPVEYRNETSKIRKEACSIGGQGVRFAHMANEFNFFVDKGELVLIRGNQGSGKSLLLKSLLCLEPLHTGQLQLNSIAYEEFSPFDIRRQIAFASSEIELIGRTVFEAISYNSNEQIRDKALCLIEQFEVNIPAKRESWLEYPLESGSRNLSEGQKQVLKIIRTLLSGKKVICLDEPFENIDETKKKTIAAYLNTLKGKCTLIIASNSGIQELQPDNIINL